MGLINISTKVDKNILCSLGESVLASSPGEELLRKSIIYVGKHQCILVTCEGKIMELCAASGNFRYDNTRESSCLSGSLSKVTAVSFEKFRGLRNMEGNKRLLFINLNIFKDVFEGNDAYEVRIKNKNSGISLDVPLSADATYSYTINNPALFYKNVCGDFEGDFNTDEIKEQLRVEVGTAFLGALMKLPADGIEYSLKEKYKELLEKEMMSELRDRWEAFRGMTPVNLKIKKLKFGSEISGFASEWICGCGHTNKGNFCTECGKPKSL